MTLPSELVQKISSYLVAETILVVAAESIIYNNIMQIDINKCIDEWNNKQQTYVKGNMLWFASIKSNSLGTLKYLYKYRRELCGMWRKSERTEVISFIKYEKPENIEEYAEISAITAEYYKQYKAFEWLKTIVL